MTNKKTQTCIECGYFGTYKNCPNCGYIGSKPMKTRTETLMTNKEIQDAINQSDKVKQLKENVKERASDERSVFYEKPVDKQFIDEQIDKAL